MTLFVFHGLDRSDGTGVRAAARGDHVAYHALRNNLVGGPLLDSDGTPCGTVIIFESADLVSAEAFIADDPYVQAGLFESMSVRSFTAIDWPGDQRAT